MPTRTRRPKTTSSTTITLAITTTPLSVNRALLTRQAAALGRTLGPLRQRPSFRDAALLEGVWNLLHSLLDVDEAHL
jgi:hypothetical protein